MTRIMQKQDGLSQIKPCLCSLKQAVQNAQRALSTQYLPNISAQDGGPNLQAMQRVHLNSTYKTNRKGLEMQK